MLVFVQFHIIMVSCLLINLAGLKSLRKIASIYKLAHVNCVVGWFLRCAPDACTLVETFLF